eukprot:4213653-Pleurochrysis_carterae.AAC.2
MSMGLSSVVLTDTGSTVGKSSTGKMVKVTLRRGHAMPDVEVDVELTLEPPVTLTQLPSENSISA